MLPLRTVATCLGALAFGLPAPAWGQEAAAADAPELVALRWEGYGESEGCLGIPSLIARVEDHLARKAFDPASAQVLSVRVDQRSGGGFRAVVRVLDASGRTLGERELVTSEPTCSALDEQLVLAVALLVDADLGAEPEAEPAPAPLPPQPPEPEPEPEPAPHIVARVSETESSPPQPWRGALDLSVLVSDGVLPSLALGAELGMEVDPPWLFPLRARVAGFLPQRTELEPGGSIDFALGLAGLAGCVLSLRTDEFAFNACAGGDLLAQRAVSEGLSGAHATTEWFFQGSAALQTQVVVAGPWYAAVGVDVGFPLAAPHFVYRRSGVAVPVFQMADTTLTAGLGIGLRLNPP